MKTEKETVILSVETATRECSLAIFRGNKLVADWRGESDFSASADLLAQIQRLLQSCEMTIDEIELLTAITGPGSFTGLRVGLAIVKGLAAVRQIPIFGIPTLAAFLCQQPLTIPICSIIPAGRHEFFWQIFHHDQNNNFDVIKTGALEQFLNSCKKLSDLRLIAPAEIHAAIFEFVKRENLKNWVVDAPPKNLAVCAALIGYKLFRQGDLSSLNWQAIYGREAIIVRQ